MRSFLGSAGEENCFSLHVYLMDFLVPHIPVTKILKPVYATLRKKGQLNVGYIDDSYLQGDTIHEFQSNNTDTCCLFTRLGCTIHCEISVQTNSETCFCFLFVLNSVSMTVCLPTEKVLGNKE